MSLLFFFLDGIGLGDVKDSNPFVKAKTPFLESLLGGRLTGELLEHHHKISLFKKLDARLGLSGLPQSATGQSSLLTGKNAALWMGRHYGPWPGPRLKALLDEDNLFLRVFKANLPIALLNAYPNGYFEALAQKRLKPNALSYAYQTSGLKLLNQRDYQAGLAISADLTGSYLHQDNPQFPLYEPQAAGYLLAKLAQNYPFSMFDFWLSDRAGHEFSFEESLELIERLDSFLAGLFEGQGQDLTILITSDHGNLEDKSHTRHSFNPVPLIVKGPGTHHFARAQALDDIASAIYAVLGL
ncbi:MAG: alkaline phosphatase family protein [Deinococcales bacterium]